MLQHAPTSTFKSAREGTHQSAHQRTSTSTGEPPPTFTPATAFIATPIPASPHRHQRGFLSPRAWGVLVVLLLVLLVPFWWSKKANNKADAEAALNNGTATPTQIAAAQTANAGALAAERAAAGGATTVDKDGVERTTPQAIAAAQAAAQTGAVANPNRHGLSFGHPPEGPLASACSGTPLDMAQPDNNQCNPYAGDTSCRTALPVLCILKVGGSAAAGFTLGTTAPVAGFVLGSVAETNARCSAELGAGWRMAEFHDSGGWNITGKRGRGLDNSNARHWVYINDQKANCWDPA